jgi:N utilization substance protein B
VSRKPTIPRSLSRQVALQVLYAVDLRDRAEPGSERGGLDATPSGVAPAPDPPAVEAAFEAVAQNFELPAGARDFAAELVHGVMARRQELDGRIREHAKNWRLSRMAAVDRNVLRLATYELIATRTPTSVILDQAIELARRFGDAPSPGFVNGVLAAVARSVRPAESVLAGAAPAGEGS